MTASPSSMRTGTSVLESEQLSSTPNAKKRSMDAGDCMLPSDCDLRCAPFKTRPNRTLCQTNKCFVTSENSDLINSRDISIFPGKPMNFLGGDGAARH